MTLSQIEAELAALLQASAPAPALTAEQLAEAERITAQMIATYASRVATGMEAAG